MKSQIRHSSFFHVGRVFCRHLFCIGLLISKLKYIIFAWSRQLFVSLLFSCASFIDSSAYSRLHKIAVMNIQLSLQGRDGIQTSCAVNRSSYSKMFLLQNIMNINGTTLFLFFLSPLVSAGPQKPQTLTASKTKNEKFGSKFFIPH